MDEIQFATHGDAVNVYRIEGDLESGRPRRINLGKIIIKGGKYKANLKAALSAEEQAVVDKKVDRLDRSRSMVRAASALEFPAQAGQVASLIQEGAIGDKDLIAELEQAARAVLKAAKKAMAS